MKKRLFLLMLTALFVQAIFSQSIKRIDGSMISADSLQNKINQLMIAANVSGACVVVFNKNKPVFTSALGLTDVQNNVPLNSGSVMYAASFAKVVFAYIAMQLVQEKKLDLDKPLAAYLSKPLPDYTIKGFKRGYQHLKNDDRYK
ncbi:MAG TPA: serine hydrolase domain-containing protein [Ferruginibacter sp.]|nr:serine hydrolase domain-containing protein [Ferruginibacter sp.]